LQHIGDGCFEPGTVHRECSNYSTHIMVEWLDESFTHPVLFASVEWYSDGRRRGWEVEPVKEQGRQRVTESCLVQH